MRQSIWEKKVPQQLLLPESRGLWRENQHSSLVRSFTESGKPTVYLLASDCCCWGKAAAIQQERAW